MLLHALVPSKTITIKLIIKKYINVNYMYVLFILIYLDKMKTI